MSKKAVMVCLKASLFWAEKTIKTKSTQPVVRKNFNLGPLKYET
jgi:hypothetical protein